MQPGDNIIGYILEQEWDKQALNKLNKALASRTEKEKYSLLQFYLGLVQCIGQFRDKFSVADWHDLSAADTAIPSSAQPQVWTVYDGRRYLYVYENNNPNFGWAPSIHQWVPLTIDMYVWDALSNTWRPIAEDNGFFSFFLKQ